MQAPFVALIPSISINLNKNDETGTFVDFGSWEHGWNFFSLCAFCVLKTFSKELQQK